ncbi:efflux RND transporter periplasmic adaptor subunit [Alistipes putredinis]|uniref:efflux RND transporter periplasmic adaptor subunit n=1 Tax=Alistipes putredinis TaxID=28117 RepID=UPI0039936CD1
MKRTIFWALLLIAAGCSSPKNTRTADPLRVTTIVAAPSAGFGAAVYVGSVEEEASASLSFPVAGTVARTLADEGQRVRKGQLLAELDSTSARQTFDAARASLEQAEDACGRLRQLYEAQSLPEIKWVEAQTRLRQAESLFEIAKKNLSDCALYAPFDGVVGERRASAGETVLPGVPVMNLLQIGTVKVRFSVPEQEIAAIGADSRMRITVPALGDRTFQAGKIEKGAVANPAAHTYDVRAALANAGASCCRAWSAWRFRLRCRRADRASGARRTAGGRRKPFRMDRARRLGRAYGRDDGPSGEQRCRAGGRRPERRPDRGGRHAEDRRRQ